MRKRAMACGLVLLLLVSLPALALAAPKPGKGGKTPTAPAPMEAGELGTMGSGSPAGSPGTIYIGATPPNLDQTKPVLVFVHGKGGSAQVWWGETSYHGTNDMYTYAYNNGYRTAFVDLYPEESMWDNGDLLNQMIDRIRSYFGVGKVTIIAHSKGGVDANAASAHYGAASKISRVITLGSPHWGTPLADMAYSTWSWWLAELMGQTTEATYVMQTGYMEWFRSVTDGLDPSMPYLTLSGYKCGPVFSALWYGCMAIGGEDDGVVPVWSARKPGGTHLKEGYWDHDEIRMGSRTWSTFAPRITTAMAPVPVVAVGPALAAAEMPLGGASGPEPPGNLILRGGEVTGEAEGKGFPVESGVPRATFLFYASHPGFVATLTGPDGAAYTVTMDGQVPAGEIFGGAWMGSLEVDAPAAGTWSLATGSSERTGYLMIASLESDLQAVVDRGRGASEPGSKRSLAVSLAGRRAVASSQVEGEASVDRGRPYARPSFAEAGGVHRATLSLPAQQGIHSLTLTVTGSLEDGTAFERTLVTSFPVLPKGAKGPWTGR